MNQKNAKLSPIHRVRPDEIITNVEYSKDRQYRAYSIRNMHTNEEYVLIDKFRKKKWYSLNKDWHYLGTTSPFLWTKVKGRHSYPPEVVVNMPPIPKRR